MLPWEGWDGYDASPLLQEHLLAAMAFARSLPDNISIPELTPENNGGISYDWCKGEGLQFSVSVYPDKLVYAGILASKRIHGEQPFTGEIPKDIDQNTDWPFFQNGLTLSLSYCGYSLTRHI